MRERSHRWSNRCMKLFLWSATDPSGAVSDLQCNKSSKIEQNKKKLIINPSTLCCLLLLDQSRGEEKTKRIRKRQIFSTNTWTRKAETRKVGLDKKDRKTQMIIYKISLSSWADLVGKLCEREKRWRKNGK